MSLGGGGGGQTGGAVVGGPSAGAAMGAGYLQSQAAQAAANAAMKQTNQAINLIREQYNNAFMAMKPYTSEGIVALNELNSYMGLGAYNPGTAPSAPEANTVENAMKHITRGDIRAEVLNNITPSVAKDGKTPFYQYTGPGYKSTSPEFPKYGKGPAYTPHGTAEMPAYGSDNAYLSFNQIVNNPDYNEAIKRQLAEDYVSQNVEGYTKQMDAYNQQMDLYNLAKSQYDNYGGPLTPEQVTEKLMSQPGVAFQYNQGLDAIQRAASAKGMLNSGRLLQSLSDYGQGMAAQQYGEHLSRLSSLVGMGQQGASQNASLSANLGNTIGGLKANLGDTLANSFLASGNAMSQALLSANQQYKVIGQQDSGGGGLGGIGSLLGGISQFAGMFGGMG